MATRWMAIAILLGSGFVAKASFIKGVTESQLSRMDPATESTSVLLETSKELLKNEQLEDALPFLEEILVRLEGDETKKGRQTLAFTIYQLGYCQMQLGEYVSAARNFVRFADAFPDDPQVDQGRIMAAQCLTMVQQWPVVEEQAALVLEDPRVESELKITATQLLAESRFQQEKWAESIKPLSALYRIAKKDVVKSGAAVMLVTAYVRLDDFGNLFRFLPNCDLSARYDVGLNVALLEAGDSHYNKGEYLKALLLYRQVMLKKDLVVHYEKRLRDVNATIKPYVADGKTTLTEYKERRMKQQKLLDRLKRQHGVIVAFQDYDMDVALRTAQCYNDLGRNWPAHSIYQWIYQENPTNALADQSRYSSFTVMLDEQEWAIATAEGYDYIEHKPDGEFLDNVTLNLMQVHMQLQQYELAYKAGRKALDISPEHKYIDQITFLMGYIRFMDMDYAEAREHFSDILVKWPDCRYYEAAEYWHAMTLLFLGEFADAESAFSAYLTNPKYDPRVYEEDSSYRLGISQYGADKFVESEETFRAFVEAYPESQLLSEAYAMLGDLRAAEGDLDIALDYYRLAGEKALNLDQINYPLFQSAKVLEADKRYSDIVELMAAYLQQWGGEGDFAHAANWQGKAFKALDEYPRALAAYVDIIDAYGNDASLPGLDLILIEIVNDYNNADLEGYRPIIVEKLKKSLDAALEDGERTRELFYKTIFAKITDGDERQYYLDSIVQAKNIPASGASTLVLIAKEGVRRGDYELVHEAKARFMDHFQVSNNMLYIMIAELDALIGQGSYVEAQELSEEILLKFGYSKSVGYARKRRGDAFRLTGDYEHALEAYKEVLGIREWRGELTPEALYWSGVCKKKMGKVDEAFAYFQRVYVLYEEYTEWVAPSYIESIRCMEALGGHEQDIINTYKEMLANEKVAATPEGVEAATRLRELVPAGEVL